MTDTYPYTTIKVNGFTYITNEPRPECGFSRNPASPWYKPVHPDNGGFRIIKLSSNDIGKLYCYCSKCFQWILDGVGDIPPHTTKFCKAAHRNPTTFQLPVDHPFMFKKVEFDTLISCFGNSVTIDSATLASVARSSSARTPSRLLSDTSSLLDKSSMEYNAATLASVARSSSVRASTTSATIKKIQSPKISSSKTVAIKSFDIFTDAKDTNSTRPRRSNGGEIDIYSPPNFLSNKQGTKRTRTLLENVNINANCDYDDDSKCSDSTSEAEFQG